MNIRKSKSRGSRKCQVIRQNRRETFFRLPDFSVHDIVLENSATWTFPLNRCEDAEISHLVINNHLHNGNSDGIDIAGSRIRDVRVSDIRMKGVSAPFLIWLGRREPAAACRKTVLWM